MIISFFVKRKGFSAFPFCFLFPVMCKREKKFSRTLFVIQCLFI